MKSEFSEIQTPASSGWFIVSANSVYHALLGFSSLLWKKCSKKLAAAERKIHPWFGHE